jgi:hypothetical protein
LFFGYEACPAFKYKGPTGKSVTQLPIEKAFGQDAGCSMIMTGY